MKVASFHFADEQSEVGLPFCHREATRAFVTSVAPLIQDYYLFTPCEVNSSILIREAPANVHILKAADLLQCMSAEPIDIWHDFGDGGNRALDQLRRFTGQKFPITGDFRVERITHYADSERPDWSSYDGVVYPSEDARNLHLCNSSAPTHRVSEIIPPCLDLVLSPPLSKGDARRLLGFSDEEVLFLCCSDFSPQHGTDLLPIITAFELAATKRSNVRLVIAGRDVSDHAAKLKSNLLDARNFSQITLSPNPDRLALAMLFAAADVFVHLPDSPSKDSPLTLLYAMANSLAIIARKWASSETFMHHLLSGVLLPMRSRLDAFEYIAEILRRESNKLRALILSQAIGFDVELLADWFVIFARDKRRRQTFGAAALKNAALRLHPEKAAQSYVRFWNSLQRNVSSDSAAATTPCSKPFRGPSIDYEKTSGPVLQVRSDQVFCLTRLGEALLAGKSFEVPEGLNEVIFPQVVLKILEQCKTKANADRVVNALAGQSKGQSGRIARCGILFHFLFCLKRGFLRINPLATRGKARHR